MTETFTVVNGLSSSLFSSPSFLIEFLSFFESQLAEYNLHLMIFRIVQLEESLDAFYCLHQQHKCDGE